MSVFENHLRYQVKVNPKYLIEAESYCQNEIGDRTFFLNGFYGGRHWRIANYQPQESSILIEVNDKNHAMILTLKYS